MTESQQGRMLLSHNFDLSEDILPKLSREEFVQVFTEGLSQYSPLKCRQLNHAHWIVEILFPTPDFSPPEVGELCAQALLNKRMSQNLNYNSLAHILILGGCKRTPPLSNDPETLQTGEWGIDVVETQSTESFLTAMEWEEKTAGKTINDIFKIDYSIQR